MEEQATALQCKETKEQREDVYSTPVYRRSRNAYTWHCAFEHFVTIMLTAQMLALLLSNVGMSDAMIGVVSSLVSMMVVVQLASVLILHRIKNPKAVITAVHCICRAFFGLMYIVPFLPISQAAKQVAVIACIVIGYAGYYFGVSYVFGWGTSYVDPKHRAVYSSTKVKISLICGFVVTLAVGYVIDRFTEADNLFGGFLFISLSVFVFVLCDLICLLHIKKQAQVRNSKGSTISLREIIDHTLKNRGYRKLLYVSLFYALATGVFNGFVGTYQLKELGFSVGMLQFLTVATGLVRFFAEKPIGMYSDRRSYISGARLGMIFFALGLVSFFLTSPSTRYLIIVYMIFNGLASAGIEQNMINVQYDFVDSCYFSEAYAMRNCLTGLCGFGTSILAGMLVNRIQSNGNKLFGIDIYAQHVLAIISFIFIAVAFLCASIVKTTTATDKK